MNDAESLAFYTAVFAADAGTDALYTDDRDTEDMGRLCIAVAEEAIRRRYAAFEAGEDFYACAFVEAAANALNQRHAATLEQLLDAGQRESDSLAGKDRDDG
jgi:hypothetical protein